MRATASGERRALDFPWPVLSKITKALMPQTITILAGAPAATKSLLSLQALAYWHDAAIPIGCYMLEDSRAFHLSRALAQRAGDSRLTDDEYLRSHPEAVAVVEQHRAWLDAFGRCLVAKPRKRIDLKQVAAWVTEQAQSGRRIIVIDPLTAASSGVNRWIDDGAFVDSIKIAAEDHGASIILVLHTDRLTGNLRGGQIYEQLAHTVLVIKSQDRETVPCVRFSETLRAEVNRTIYVQKSRLGIGTGSTLGFYFDPATLTFAEQGIVQRKGAKGKDNAK
jgi:hypothetical protein